MKGTRKIFKNFDRNLALLGVIYFVSGVIILRLFYIQVLQHDHYKDVAAKEHYGYSELPARRGEIFIKDYASNELARIATNTTLNSLYADTLKIKDKSLVASRIAPLLFNLEEQRKIDDERVQNESLKAQTPEELSKIKPLTDDELKNKFYDSLLEKISQNIRPKILLSSKIPLETLKKIDELKLAGIEVKNSDLLAYPLQISDKKSTAQTLSPYLEVPALKLTNILQGENRYQFLKDKIQPEVSQQIKKLIQEDKTDNFSGLILEDDYYRFYPEGKLAANILGFVRKKDDGTIEGVYGIEEKFNSELQGKKGIFQTSKDSIGRQITVGETLIQPAVDGQNIVLTIDRSIQTAVEKKLERAVKDYKADNGEVVIMNPKTGEIIAMAHYPSFDPNNYGKVYDMEEIKLNEEEINKLKPLKNQENWYEHYRNFDLRDKISVKKVIEDGKEIYKKYINDVGPEAYKNKIVSDLYEPGSVFKVIAMAIGIDDKDVSTNTAFNDPGFVEVELKPGVKKKITNVSAKCTGHVTMTDVLANSCNTGMSFVAKKMGMNLFYSYMKKFGFGERTEIEFDNEAEGTVRQPPWAESELYNHAFGQGISVTPIQMATALSAIANKGILMQPHIIESVEKEKGKIMKTDALPLGTVISPETANTITSMMINAVENGVAKKAALPDHYIAGKTGTSQTVEGGTYVDGVGKTIASIGGFGPIDDPKFVILVKMDRPRTTQFADSTAGLLFKDIASFLFDYYSIPPDKKK